MTDPMDLIREGKIKRYFRSKRKLTVPKFVSHITQRAAGKELLFVEDKDYLYMLSLLKDVSQNRSLNIYSFCFLQNHIHLLLSPENDNLSDVLRDLFSRYAMKFNKKYERKGHLFGGPYRQAVCLDDAYLLAASLYIHLNPVNAGLVKDPSQYRWSSVRLFVDPKAPRSFVKDRFILRLLGENISGARKTYQEMLKHGSRLKAGFVLEQENAIEEFKERMILRFPIVFHAAARMKQIFSLSGMDLLSMEALDQKIEAAKGEGLLGKPGSIKAKKYLIEQLIARGYKRAEIAGRLEISVKTVYNILRSLA